MILERMLEEQSGYRQNLRMMSELLDQCINEVAKMIQVGDGMRAKLEEINRVRDQDSDHAN